MHEYSLARGLLQQLQQRLDQEGAQRILAVRLIVGEFSGIDAELLKIALSHSATEEGLGDIDVAIDSVKLQIQCDECGAITDVQRFRFECARCQSRSVSIAGGEELILDSATMEFDS